MTTPIIQEEATGCAIASTAVLAKISYKEAKRIANDLGIFSEDKALWSETNYIRRLLSNYNIETNKDETPFKKWDQLPNRALLAINWHLEDGKPYWHWVVFVRENSEQYVLDSSPRLLNNTRKNFSEIDVKWYIEIIQS